MHNIAMLNKKGAVARPDVKAKTLAAINQDIAINPELMLPILSLLIPDLMANPLAINGRKRLISEMGKNPENCI